jgi:hypothetical protein
LDLGFQVTNLEHQIEPVPGIEGYMASSWLGFVRPLSENSIGSIDIPVLLRAYPTPPSLLRQEGVQIETGSSSASSSLENAKRWNYRYTYAQLHTAQDTIVSQVKFNLTDTQNQLALVESMDLFTALAQFVSVYQQLQQVFATDLSQITLASDPKSDSFKRAQNAVAAFAGLVQQLPEPWADWHTPSSSLMAVQSSAIDFEFSIAEAEAKHTIAGQDALLITITPLSILPPDVPLPQVIFDGYTAYPGPDPNTFLYRNADGQYYPWNTALNTPNRVVSFDLDVMEYQNAWSAVRIIRNQDLIWRNPTNESFIYQTPQVRFSSKLTPFLDNDEPIYVNQIAAPSQKKLIDHMVTLFSTFLMDSATSAQTIKLECSYSYVLYELDGNSDLPIVTLPILLATPFTFNIPADFTVPAAGCPSISDSNAPFICKITNAIKIWFATYNPSREHGVFTFDISVFSNLNRTNLPLIRLSNVVLEQQYILDL